MVCRMVNSNHRLRDCAAALANIFAHTSSGTRRKLRGRQPAASAEHGFTYLGVLFAVFFISVGLGGAAEVWHTAQKREKERELLFIGNQFRLAIANYYNKSPGGAKDYPKELSDLLQDKRFVVMQRHLRKIYADPMTGSKEWGLVKSHDDRITGVYSLSEAQPMKTANFAQADKEFEGKEKYSEWKFVYAPQLVTGGPPTSAGPGSPAPIPAASGSPAIGSAIGSPAIGPSAPGSQFPGSAVPGSQFPGSSIPGSQFPGPAAPGSQFPGPAMPDSQFPGSAAPPSSGPVTPTDKTRPLSAREKRAILRGER
jgi:hypothetical protein